MIALFVAEFLVSCTREPPDDVSGNKPTEKSSSVDTIDEAQVRLEETLTDLETLPTRSREAL